jgi:hypothetical protein
VQSQLSKTYDSLPPQLFSTSTLTVIFRDDLPVESSMGPWCPLPAALTLPEITAQTRVELLEIDFCFLPFYWGLKFVLGDSPGVIEQISEACEASLHRMSEFLDVLNRFVSLTMLLRDASSLLEPIRNWTSGAHLWKGQNSISRRQHNVDNDWHIYKRYFGSGC